MRRKELLFVLLVCLLTAAGCGRPVTLHNMAVKVKELAERGEWYVVEEVRHGDIFRATASFVWPEPGAAGGHSFRWNIYQDGVLIRAGRNDVYFFQSSPFKVLLTIDSSALKPGDVEMVLYLDNKECGRLTTRIVKKALVH